MKQQNKSWLRKLSILDILSPIALFIYTLTDNAITSVICALVILAHLSYKLIYLHVSKKTLPRTRSEPSGFRSPAPPFRSS